MLFVMQVKIFEFLCTKNELKICKIAKWQNGPIWEVFGKPKACGQTVLPDKSALIGQKLVNMSKSKIQMWHFE